MKILHFILLISLIACSPVRNRYMTRDNDERLLADDSIRSIENEKEEAVVGNNLNVKDTLIVKLPPLYIAEGKSNAIRSMSAELDSAIFLFNNGKQNEACEKFNLLQETLKEQDSLYYESIFYSAECLIVNNEYKLANRLLNNIMGENLSSSLKQRVLLRQGHLLCALDDESTAQWYFDKLKSDFPKSIYLALANCESLK